MDQLRLENKLLVEGNHLKDIILHSLYNKNTECYLMVSPSRFAKILSDYYSLNAITPLQDVNTLANMYKYYSFTSKDIGHESNNHYTIIKDKNLFEYVGRCSDCDCKGHQIREIAGEEGRWIDGKTKECYFREMIKTNYTTKVKLD